VAVNERLAGPVRTAAVAAADLRRRGRAAPEQTLRDEAGARDGQPEDPQRQNGRADGRRHIASKKHGH
jgi:hypothetical protein